LPTKPKFTEKELHDLIDQAKKDYLAQGRPLQGMTRNLDGAECVAMSFFLASLSILNRLTGERISDKVSLLFADLDGDSIFE
jgi:hypothetical protein